jgi:hypothetical protein
VQTVQHVTQEFVRVLLLIAAEPGYHLPDGLTPGINLFLCTPYP